MSPHTRETRASANEIKFVLDEALGEQIRQWARARLEPDPHGTGPFQDEYHTTSLYFDTTRFDVLHRRGSHGRAKYRVRRYGAADMVFLERKLRKPGILVKRRTLASADVLGRLHDQEIVEDWPGEWFRRRLLVRRLQPVCLVSYNRTARAALNGNAARLTLDGGLRAVATESARFIDESGQPVLEGRMILELKYRQQIPAIFKQLVEEFALETQSASKYRLSMEALGHATSADEIPVAGRKNAAHA